MYGKNQGLSRTEKVHSGWGGPEKCSYRGGEGRTEPLFLVAHRGTPSPKRMPSGRGGRDRFTAESYTVLGKEGRCQEESGEPWSGL